MPSGRPAWLLASTVPCGVRTFLSLHTAGRDHPIDLSLGGVLYHTRPRPSPVYPAPTKAASACQGASSQKARAAPEVEGSTQIRVAPTVSGCKP